MRKAWPYCKCCPYVKDPDAGPKKCTSCDPFSIDALTKRFELYPDDPSVVEILKSRLSFGRIDPETVELAKKFNLFDLVQYDNPSNESIEEMKLDARLRVWVAIHYPVSLKDNWKQILDDSLICCAACLHDKDVYEDDDEARGKVKGELKDPHIHFVFRFSGPKSFTQVYNILKSITKEGCNCPPPEKPHSDIDHCVRYLVHYDHKQKAQYARSSIISICGFDVDRYFRLNDEQTFELFRDLRKYIFNRNIDNYWSLFAALEIDYFKDAEYEEMYRYAIKYTYRVNALLKAKKDLYFEEKEKNEKKEK